MNNTVKARVYAGAAFLDSFIGTKWAKKIDPELFSICSGDSCILGQTFGDYGNGLAELGIDNDEARTLGFERSDTVSYGDLQDEWLELLANRKRQASRARTLRKAA